MMLNTNDSPTALPGTPDERFNPAPLLARLDGFELHGICRWEARARTCFALSNGREYALAVVDNDGAADTDFGAAGIVCDSYGSNVGNGITPGRRVAVLGDTLVIGGMTEHAPGQYSPAFACYDAQGHRVTRFNGSGQLVLADLFAQTQSKVGAIRFETNLALCSATGVAVDGRFAAPTRQMQDFNQINFDMRVANGKLYVVATGRIADDPRLSGLVVCITADGQLDEAFGDHGITALQSSDYSVLLRSIALHDNGIYVGGGAAGGSNPALAARIDYAGVHDQGFGTEGGYALTRQAFRINDVVLDSQGRLFAVGVGSSVRAIAVSFSAEGVQDDAYGYDGAYIPGLDYSSLTYAAIDEHDRLVFIGDYLEMQSGYLRAMVTRLLPSGTPDSSFGVAGVARLGILDAIGASLLIQPDGKLVATGYTDRAVYPYAIRLFA